MAVRSGSNGRVVAARLTAVLWRGGSNLLLALLALYILLPVVAVLLYGLATRWTATPLPDGYTLRYWASAFEDSRIVGALGRSLLLAATTVVLDVIAVVPALYAAHAGNRRIRVIAELAAVIPFALPWVAIAFGILLLAGQFTPALLGTPLLLALAYAALHFPFLYWAVDGAMSAVDIATLGEAAETCGATRTQTICRIVLPNILGGIASGGILVFASSFGEFALVQMLVGGSFETIPLWSADALGATAGKFPELAVVTFATFVLLFALSALLVFGTGSQTVRLIPGGPAVARKG
jgi:putative spermidine/putrescine transport system permease protein